MVTVRQTWRLARGTAIFMSLCLFVLGFIGASLTCWGDRERD